jgi:hypothetical protein
MALPDYLICLNCETPCYDFEYREDVVTEILCPMCGNEEVDQFITPDEFDSLISDG